MGFSIASGQSRTTLYSLLSSGQFSARWIGFIQPTQSTVYTFRTVLAGLQPNVEKYRLYIDNVLGMDSWTVAVVATNPTYSLALVAGVAYELKLDYRCTAGTTDTDAKGVRLDWAYPSNAMAAVPSTALYLPSHVTNSPSSVTVRPSGTCAALSSISSATSSLNTATAGLTSTFTVSARDTYGNVKSLGGDSLRVTLSGAGSASGVVVDNSDGTYLVTYVTSRTGTYDMTVMLGPSQVATSPFRIITQPARRHFQSSVARGASLTLATAGVAGTFTITVLDRHGNYQPFRWTGNDPLLVCSLADGTSITSSVDAASPVIAGAAVTSVSTPTTLDSPLVYMSYAVTRSGSYGLFVNGSAFREDGAVGGSPFSLVVVPHIACAAASIPRGSGLSLATSGVSASFTVSIADGYTNARTVGGDVVASWVRVDPSSTGTADIVATTTDSSNGKHSVSYVATKAAPSTLQSQSSRLWAQLVAGGGLVATYFDGTNPRVSRADSVVSFSAAASSIGTLGVGSYSSGSYSLVWAGAVRPSTSGVFTFFVGLFPTTPTAAISFSLLVNNVPITSLSSAVPTGTLYSGALTLPTANAYYDVSLTYTSPYNVDSGVALRASSSSRANSVLTTSEVFRTVHLVGSPFAVAVTTTSTCATLSTSSISGVVGYLTAGSAATFTMQARDAAGNLLDRFDDGFSFGLLSGTNTVGPTAMSALQPSLRDGGVVELLANSSYVGIGAFNLNYTRTVAGQYTVRGMYFQVGGLIGEYFENDDLTDNNVSPTGAIATARAFFRVDPTINFSWGLAAPVTSAEVGTTKSIGGNFFSVRWTGSLKPQFAEVYTFSAEVSDGVRVYVNDLLVLNFWTATAAIQEGTVGLIGGVLYPLRVEYREAVGNATMRLSWRSRSQAAEIVPSSRLYFNVTAPSLSSATAIVEPAAICAARSTATGAGLSVGSAGTIAAFTVQVRDQFSNPRKVGDFPDLFGRLTTSVWTLQRSVPVTVASRLASLDHTGGLSATYYTTNSFSGTMG